MVQTSPRKLTFQIELFSPWASMTPELETAPLDLQSSRSCVSDKLENEMHPKNPKKWTPDKTLGCGMLNTAIDVVLSTVECEKKSANQQSVL